MPILKLIMMSYFNNFSYLYTLHNKLVSEINYFLYLATIFYPHLFPIELYYNATNTIFHTIDAISLFAGVYFALFASSFP